MNWKKLLFGKKLTEMTDLELAKKDKDAKDSRLMMLVLSVAILVLGVIAYSMWPLTDITSKNIALVMMISVVALFWSQIAMTENDRAMIYAEQRARQVVKQVLQEFSE